MSQQREFLESDTMEPELVTRRDFFVDSLRASAAGLLALTTGCSSKSRIEFSKEMETRGTVGDMTYIKGLPLTFGETGLPGQLTTPDTYTLTVKYFHENTPIEERSNVDQNLFEQLKDGAAVIVHYKVIYRVKKTENKIEERVTDGYKIISIKKAQ